MATKAQGKPESPRIAKMRQKLKEKLEKEEKKISREALEKVRAEIYNWLNRHAKQRISLKNRTITTFDQNRHPAQIQSKFVDKLLVQLKGQVAHPHKTELERDRVSKS